ncbi:MbcA/ParS/Xre antitoxin family protein [Roseivivax marinus]|uniref:MbcA/ParS/Xre antitoxin family protein n=1 Tax=Roseivivax marinus TaxID=1379903 RepID=UPI00273FA846|nr:MbcA/ParS/Xre antitoxin family protein [Roseivivax marinus]
MTITHSEADRRRLSGPGLRSFLRICERWSLTREQQIALLGAQDAAAYDALAAAARDKDPDFMLPEDVLMRISAVLGIYKALESYLPEQDRIDWLTSPHRGLDFDGLRPLRLMMSGEFEDLLMVRRYLDDRYAGFPPPGSDDYEPIAEGDIIWTR